MKTNEHLWRQFFRLGEMIGDGLHYEPDGKWIAKEYRQLAKILIPEMKEENSIRRKLNVANIDAQMAKLNMPEYITENIFCKALKIDKKESKRMRDEGEVSYTQVKNKIYYRTKEVIELIFKNK